jgi:hypothetical protein
MALVGCDWSSLGPGYLAVAEWSPLNHWVGSLPSAGAGLALHAYWTVSRRSLVNLMTEISQNATKVSQDFHWNVLLKHSHKPDYLLYSKQNKSWNLIAHCSFGVWTLLLLVTCGNVGRFLYKYFQNEISINPEPNVYDFLFRVNFPSFILFFSPSASLLTLLSFVFRFWNNLLSNADFWLRVSVFYVKYV